MHAELIQAGERLLVDCRWAPLSRLLAEGGARAWQPAAGSAADVHVEVQSRHTPFDVRGWAPLTRGGYARGGAVVLCNACGSGFDLRLTVAAGQLTVEARWRPPVREHLASRLLRSRFHLLVRATLLQYPALWWAGCRGRVPMHASAVTIGPSVPLLAGPGGTGRSSLLLGAVAAGEHACSDNLCVTDGRDVHGLVEPMRVEDGGGRRMAHGRTECPLPGRLDTLRPNRLVLLRREASGRPEVHPLDPARAARALAAGTYTAGELRRYWPFAAALALGTGRGPAHPPISAAALEIARRLPAHEIVLGDRPEEGLAALYRLATEASERAEAMP
ncbi:hypothetical protein OG223_45595 [Streptomyces sp. NBC_01478]|uniref:hypothetical protein n=1 Tax=Streptomyces sp. NBC_01478 TaxID=2903882 RepID=UPI002E35D027|nr:hypothetical protein [Streptomyces sp. NBC_01478]